MLGVAFDNIGQAQFFYNFAAIRLAERLFSLIVRVVLKVYANIDLRYYSYLIDIFGDKYYSPSSYSFLFP